MAGFAPVREGACKGGERRQERQEVVQPAASGVTLRGLMQGMRPRCNVCKSAAMRFARNAGIRVKIPGTPFI
jgi:hypothetical protein